MKEKIKKFRLSIFLIIFLAVILTICFSAPTEAFYQEYDFSYSNPPGFFYGVWHGLLAPYSLIARWFIEDVLIYAIPNTGWFYDAGFLCGVAGSLPIGWLAAIISMFLHVIIY